VLLLSINEESHHVLLLDAVEYLLKPLSSEDIFQSLLKLESLNKKNIQTVVIADEEESQLQNYIQYLSSKEIKIEVINKIDNAIELIEYAKPDLAILNLTNSKVDAISLASKIKSNSELKSVPILFTLESELSEKIKTYLTTTFNSLTTNSGLQTTEAFNFLKDWIKKQDSHSYSLSSTEQISAKVEIEKSNLPEPQLVNIENGELDIMIVDDDPNTLFTLAEIIQSTNCNPIVAHNGKECLELLETKIPDLILLDIIMPEMDGFKTIEQIKKNKKWSEIPVFAVTAKAMKEDNEIILKHGFNDYIPKPVNPAFVSYKIQSIINQLKLT